MNALGVCLVLALAVYTIFYDRVLLAINLSILTLYFFLSTQSRTPAAKQANSVWRRMRLAMWGDPFTPEVLGEERVLISRTLRFIENYYNKTGKKITLTHALLKACGIALSKANEIRGKIAFGAFSPSPDTRITMFIPAEDGRALKWMTLEEMDKKSLGAIHDECLLAKAQMNCPVPIDTLRKLPTCILSLVLEIASLLTMQLGINLPALGLKQEPFAPLVVTNYGDLQADMIWAPFAPFCRAAIAVTSSKATKEAVSTYGKIAVEDVLHLCATFDHRFIDGTRGSVVANDVKKVLENPEEYFQ